MRFEIEKPQSNLVPPCELTRLLSYRNGPLRKEIQTNGDGG